MVDEIYIYKRWSAIGNRSTTAANSSGPRSEF